MIHENPPRYMRPRKWDKLGLKIMFPNAKGMTKALNRRNPVLTSVDKELPRRSKLKNHLDC